jgi:transposase
MIPHGVEVFIGLDPIDLRWGFDRLAGVVQERIGRDSRSGALFVFFGKRRSSIKIFFCDATGVCTFYKRLDKGIFRLPEPAHKDASAVVVEEHVLDALLDGIEVLPAKTRRLNPARLH